MEEPKQERQIHPSNPYLPIVVNLVDEPKSRACLSKDSLSPVQTATAVENDPHGLVDYAFDPGGQSWVICQHRSATNQHRPPLDA